MVDSKFGSLEDEEDLFEISFEHPSNQQATIQQYEEEISQLKNKLSQFRIMMRHKTAQIAKKDDEIAFLARQAVDSQQALRICERRREDEHLLHEASKEALKNLTFDHQQLVELHAALSNEYKLLVQSKHKTKRKNQTFHYSVKSEELFFDPKHVEIGIHSEYMNCKVFKGKWNGKGFFFSIVFYNQQEVESKFQSLFLKYSQKHLWKKNF